MIKKNVILLLIDKNVFIIKTNNVDGAYIIAISYNIYNINTFIMGSITVSMCITLFH